MQYLAAGWCVSQSGDHTGLAGLQLGFANVSGRTKHFGNHLRCNRCMIDFAARDLSRDAPTNSSDLTLELAHAGFMRVIADDPAKRILLELTLPGFEPVLLQLSGDQISLRNLEFLALGVTRDRDYFYPVAQRFRYSVDVICRADENNLRKIKRHIEITINECMVLCRIEHFEQCACGVATKIRTNFVDLVEHKNRVACAAATQFLNDSSRHRADIGAAMTANLSFITHSAETDPHKFAAEGIGDRLTQTGFADAGGPEKTEDRAV